MNTRSLRFSLFAPLLVALATSGFAESPASLPTFGLLQVVMDKGGDTSDLPKLVSKRMSNASFVLEGGNAGVTGKGRMMFATNPVKESEQAPNNLRVFSWGFEVDAGALGGFLVDFQNTQFKLEGDSVAWNGGLEGTVGVVGAGGTAWLQVLLQALYPVFAQNSDAWSWTPLLGYQFSQHSNLTVGGGTYDLALPLGLAVAAPWDSQGGFAASTVVSLPLVQVLYVPNNKSGSTYSIPHFFWWPVVDADLGVAWGKQWPVSLRGGARLSVDTGPGGAWTAGPYLAIQF